MPLSPAEGGCGAAEGVEGEGARAWGGAGRGRRGGAAEGRREKASRLLREQQQNSNKTATYGERAAGPSRGAGQGVEGEGAGVEGEGAGVEGCGCGCVVEGGAGAVEGEGVSRAGPSRGRGGCFYCGAFVALLWRFCLPSRAARGQQKGSGLREGREGAGVLAEVVEKMEGVGAIEAEGEFFGALLALFWP